MPDDCPPPRPLWPMEAVRASLSHDWLRWVAENRLRGCTPESMMQTMTAAGVDPALARAAIELIRDDPVYQAFTPFRQLQRKLESMLANLQKLHASAPHYAQVERRSRLSRDEFMERYVFPARPVVITDLADDWPARRKWTPLYLKERFGDVEVEVQAARNSDKRYEANKLKLRQRVRLGDFVDRVLAGSPTNDYYLTANNEALKDPRLAALLDDVGTLPPYCDRSSLAAHSSLWFGPAGAITPLHHDTIMLMHTQIVGRKRWRFISPLDTPHVYNHVGVFSEVDLEQPDLIRHPAIAEVKIAEAVVEPGETIFLPLSWWHQVASLDMCISFSFDNLEVPNSYSYENPDVHHW
jgi:ribosomal protein L16 Arg81 hydroxylase